MTELTDILSSLKLCPEDAWNRMSKTSKTRPTAVSDAIYPLISYLNFTQPQSVNTSQEETLPNS